MEFKEFARRPDAYQKICGLIAPSIFGHDDVKKAVACLLFGGARKVGLLSWLLLLITVCWPSTSYIDISCRSRFWVCLKVFFHMLHC